LPHRFEFRAGYRRAVRRWEVDLLRSQLVVDLVGDERVRPDQQTAPSERLARVVEDVDATIRQIRTSIFQLRGPLGPETSTTRKQLLAIAAESAGSIGFEPQIHFSGPVDSVVDDDVLEDLVAVLREALANVARHAEASRADVSVTVDAGEITLEVSDDGRGIDSERRSGLANLQARAETHGGTLRLIAPRDEGTCLIWTIPIAKLV
jgi:signal transduction histidine kinase